MPASNISKAFIWKRLHSISGFFLVLFLIEHLLVNSQAVLWLGDDGWGFIRAVDSIHELPYLPVIETLFLGFPIVIHMIWGIKYALTAKPNSGNSDGSLPSLPEYPRNHAFTWQRVTAWLLIFGIIAHVVEMRFLDYPVPIGGGDKTQYVVQVTLDPGLYTVADRLGVILYDSKKIEALAVDESASESIKVSNSPASLDWFLYGPPTIPYDEADGKARIDENKRQYEKKWAETLKKISVEEGSILAVAPDFGRATLLTVRDTFKSPSMAILYSLFVVAASFHAFNGLWTFMIKWGVILTPSAQNGMQIVSKVMMFIVALLGLASIWGTYGINLNQ